MREEQAPRLKRSIYPMPDFIQSALLKHGLLEAYQRRPAYQRNDYIGWITGAKQQATREKRLNQMLDELATGDRYMNMAIEQSEIPSKTVSLQEKSIGGSACCKTLCASPGYWILTYGDQRVSRKGNHDTIQEPAIMLARNNKTYG